jgi:hypothetical protein
MKSTKISLQFEFFVSNRKIAGGRKPTQRESGRKEGRIGERDEWIEAELSKHIHRVQKSIGNLIKNVSFHRFRISLPASRLFWVVFWMIF